MNSVILTENLRAAVAAAYYEHLLSTALMHRADRGERETERQTWREINRQEHREREKDRQLERGS